MTSSTTQVELATRLFTIDLSLADLLSMQHHICYRKHNSFHINALHKYGARPTWHYVAIPRTIAYVVFRSTTSGVGTFAASSTV